MPVIENEQMPTQILFQLPRCAVFYLIAMFLLVNCAHPPHGRHDSPEDCMVEIAFRVRAKSEKKYLHTLDGQDVRIDDFLHQCEMQWPECCLYEKFYHWKNEVLTVETKSERDTTKQWIRAYYNPFSVCHPEKVHPERVLGDVAEIYDSEMNFTGLSVYMGDGIYIHLSPSR
jgi:hypothetical protein